MAIVRRTRANGQIDDVIMSTFDAYNAQKLYRACGIKVTIIEL